MTSSKERTRSRSRSPLSRDYYRRYGRSRSRSRSPAPRPRKSGFKWKEKSSRDTGTYDSRSSGLQRGYKEQDRRERERYRERSKERETQRDILRDRHRYNDRSREPQEDSHHNLDNHRTRRRERHNDARRDGRDQIRGYQEGRERDMAESPTTKEEAIVKERPGKEKKEKTGKKTVVQPTQEMIVVYVNDRLGTKAQIPCLPSDPIKLFKAQVAAKIGREPHEIMLKRQGERPFKDQLTLEDYGVSNGVQLDLEVDTGD